MLESSSYIRPVGVIKAEQQTGPRSCSLCVTKVLICHCKGLRMALVYSWRVVRVTRTKKKSVLENQLGDYNRGITDKVATAYRYERITHTVKYVINDSH